ncbi:MAG: hypothetical protein GOP50_05485, partial [Candidatus Heimdallarchaeota archaeon]|nr:hypothetical protein [Candidatus Heimdallarchaeota archaeon]
MSILLLVTFAFNLMNIQMINAITTNIEQGGNSEITVIEPGNPALDFTIMDVDSRINYTLSNFLGQAVLLDLWA